MSEPLAPNRDPATVRPARALPAGGAEGEIAGLRDLEAIAAAFARARRVAANVELLGDDALPARELRRGNRAS